MTERITVDITERDLIIAVTQAKSMSEEALRTAQKNLDEYLQNRLALQIQRRKMQVAAKQAEAAGYTGKGSTED